MLFALMLFIVILILIYYVRRGSCPAYGKAMTDSRWLSPGEYFGLNQIWESYDSKHIFEVSGKGVCLDKKCTPCQPCQKDNPYVTLSTSGMLSLIQGCGSKGKLFTQIQLPPDTKVGWSLDLPNIVVLADTVTNALIPPPAALVSMLKGLLS